MITMAYMISLNNKECCLNFNDESGVYYNGHIKDVALMFARHLFNTYNGYTTYIINNCIQISHISNNFIMSWVGDSWIDGNIKLIPVPKWWNEFQNEFNKIMKMKAFM
jgi:hypothetical protein